MSDFWNVIGRNELSSAESVATALAKVEARLAAAATSSAYLREFDQWLSRQVSLLDREELFKVKVVNRDGKEFRQSEDHFLYARCACILAGSAAVSDVLAGRRSFADFTAIRLQSAELLLYLAAELQEALGHRPS
jgi:hypothetical protein